MEGDNNVRGIQIGFPSDANVYVLYSLTMNQFLGNEFMRILVLGFFLYIYIHFIRQSHVTRQEELSHNGLTLKISTWCND